MIPDIDVYQHVRIQVGVTVCVTECDYLGVDVCECQISKLGALVSSANALAAYRKVTAFRCTKARKGT